MSKHYEQTHLFGPGVRVIVPQVIGECCRCGGEATHMSPSGYRYCASCAICRRGHPIRWKQEESTGLWLCECYWWYGETVEQIALDGWRQSA